MKRRSENAYVVVATNIARIFDICGSTSTISDIVKNSNFSIDKEAIADDFEMVGLDISSAMENIDNEIQSKQKTAKR